MQALTYSSKQAQYPVLILVYLFTFAAIPNEGRLGIAGVTVKIFEIAKTKNFSFTILEILHLMAERIFQNFHFSKNFYLIGFWVKFESCSKNFFVINVKG